MTWRECVSWHVQLANLYTSSHRNPRLPRHLIGARGIADTTIVVDPLEDLGVPHEAVLRADHPVVFVGEVEKLARHTFGMQHVEEQDAFANWKAEIQIIVNYKVRLKGYQYAILILEGLPFRDLWDGRYNMA